MRVLRLLILLIVLIANYSAQSQDIQFSQFYAASLYLNPAFAGSAHMPRLSLHERLQWPQLEAKYITSLFSADMFFKKYNSGVGLMVTNDIQGASVIKSNDATLQYAYEFNLTQVFTVRAGLQVSWVSRNINYANLFYPDQFNDFGATGGGPTDPTYYGQQKVNYADVGSGGLVYSDKLWFGFSAHHLNKPNQSFVEGVSRLPAKFSFVAGYRFSKHSTSFDHYRKERQVHVIPTIHYKFQGKSDQLDMGIYGIYNNMILNIWYRGIPLKNYRKTLPNNESIVVGGGYKFKDVSVSYSYDITISKLKLVRTTGAHELNITYVFKDHKKRKPMRRLPCPKFHGF